MAAWCKSKEGADNVGLARRGQAGVASPEGGLGDSSLVASRAGTHKMGCSGGRAEGGGAELLTQVRAAITQGNAQPAIDFENVPAAEDKVVDCVDVAYARVNERRGTAPSATAEEHRVPRGQAWTAARQRGEES
eukprot:scaffold88629_cov59-Phaeocystis_antarctica.AAC.5